MRTKEEIVEESETFLGGTDIGLARLILETVLDIREILRFNDL